MTANPDAHVGSGSELYRAQPASASGSSSFASSSSSHAPYTVASEGAEAEKKLKKGRKGQPKLRLSKKAGPSASTLGSRGGARGSGGISRSGAVEEDDDWTFEGGEGDYPAAGPGTGHGVNGHSNGRTRSSIDAARRAVEPPGTANSGHSGLGGLPEHTVPAEKEKEKERESKESKGRRLVKKTSQLFGRKDKDKDKDRDRLGVSNPASSSSSVYLPLASRQSSKSSGDSYSQQSHIVPSHQSHDQRKPMASRVPSGSSILTANGSNAGSNQIGGFLGLRRPSQESQAALGAYTANGGSGLGAQLPLRQKQRTGSASTYESSIDAPSPLIPSGPVPAQRRPSQLSASVPALPRQSSQSSQSSQPIPTPAPAQAQQQGPSVPTRMSAWFSGLISSSAGSDASSTTTTTDPTTSPLRPTSGGTATAPVTRGPSAAASFLNAARQKAVEGVRNLLDSEAQPDRCTDPIWLMGVSHPGYQPPTAFPPFGHAAHDVAGQRLGGRPGSSGSGAGAGSEEGPLSTPPPAERDKGIRTGWQRRQLERPPGSPAKGLGQLFGGSTVSLVGSPSKDSAGRSDESPNRAKKGKEREVLRWPEEFHTDFRSTVWCTYRSQYAPILALPQDTLIPSADRYYAAFGPPADLAHPSEYASSVSAQASTANGLASKPSAWGWSRSEERGLTSDAGWGCMLRTGQSMLANALISLHLGRDWRVPAVPPSLEPTTPAELLALQRYATYARILSYFLDDPSPLSPFSVHRMALIGKALGKEVGEWFGPSTAQGALKTLANAFPPCGLTVVGGADGMVYRSEVIEASHAEDGDWASYASERGQGSPSLSQGLLGSRKGKRSSKMPLDEGKWGRKAVLILIGLRLGLDGVNPIYHDSIKALFTFPQSVGIAGGRPSSSYYFVASQANSLFYLDPHFTRPAIPLEVPPSFTPSDEAVKPAPAASSSRSQQTGSSSSASSPALDQSDEFLASSVTIPAGETVDNEEAILLPEMSASAILADERAQGGAPTLFPGAREGYKPYRLDMVDADDLSSGSEPSFSPTKPPRTQSTPGQDDLSRPRSRLVPAVPVPGTSHAPSSAASSPLSPQLGFAPEAEQEADVFSAPPRRASLAVDAETKWYATAYAEAQLKTYHCDKVRKIPLSALDPSMLLGFLVRDEADFEDFCERVAKLPQKIFSVLDEPPVWDDAASAGLESVSEPDFSDEDEDEDDRGGSSPLTGSFTLPARSKRTDSGSLQKEGGFEAEDEDLSATVRSLGMERDETVRGGLSGVVDAGAPRADETEVESVPTTPRVAVPPSLFTRPSIVLVERPKADEPRNAIPRPSEADTIKR